MPLLTGRIGGNVPTGDIVIAVTRKRPARMPEGWHWLPALAPSSELLSFYLERRKLGPDAWWPQYVERFRSEMASDAVRDEDRTGDAVVSPAKALKWLERESQKRTIVIVCFCADERFCHRSLLKEMVDKQSTVSPSGGTAHRLVVSGSRTIIDETFIATALGWALSQFEAIGIVVDTVVHGGARGVDRIAGRHARAIGLTVQEIPADWQTYGRSAGYRRNKAMISEYADVGLAVWDGKSPGTAHAAETMIGKGIPTIVINMAKNRFKRYNWPS